MDLLVYKDNLCQFLVKKNNFASSGNRTRAARVAGEHSTTEPTMPHENVVIFGHYY